MKILLILILSLAFAGNQTYKSGIGIWSAVSLRNNMEKIAPETKEFSEEQYKRPEIKLQKSFPEKNLESSIAKLRENVKGYVRREYVPQQIVQEEVIPLSLMPDIKIFGTINDKIVVSPLSEIPISGISRKQTNKIIPGEMVVDKWMYVGTKNNRAVFKNMETEEIKEQPLTKLEETLMRQESMKNTNKSPVPQKSSNPASRRGM